MNGQQIRLSISLLERPEIHFIGISDHEPGVRRYLLPDLWSLHLYRYQGELSFHGHRFPFHSGYASLIPPGAFYEYQMDVRAVHAVSNFKLPESEASDRLSIAAMQDLNGGEHKRFDALYLQMEQAFAFHALQPRRAEVRLWDILWQLIDDVQVPASDQSDLHPSILKAIQLIETRLSKPILIAELAREVGLSHDRLTKLFRASFDTTVAGYILERRVSRATALLHHSTMQIKSIATEVGFSDVQVLNKVMRRATGHSPRTVRKNRIDWAHSPVRRVRPR